MRGLARTTPLRDEVSIAAAWRNCENRIKGMPGSNYSQPHSASTARHDARQPARFACGSRPWPAPLLCRPAPWSLTGLHTQFADATTCCSTIRLKLLKLGALRAHQRAAHQAVSRIVRSASPLAARVRTRSCTIAECRRHDTHQSTAQSTDPLTSNSGWAGDHAQPRNSPPHDIPAPASC